MQVDMMKLDPRIANIYYKDYRDSVRRFQQERRENKSLTKSDAEKEAEIFKATYYAMAQGKTILNVSSAISDAGLNEDGLPNLALAQADWQNCFLELDNGRLVFSRDGFARFNWRARRYRDQAIWFRSSILPQEFGNTAARKEAGHKPLGRHKAVVPVVPAHLRLQADLDRYHILWDAIWDPSPPVDPILLRHIAGHMYAVIAQWDLTPIEQSVLGHRIS